MSATATRAPSTHRGAAKLRRASSSVVPAASGRERSPRAGSTRSSRPERTRVTGGER